MGARGRAHAEWRRKAGAELLKVVEKGPLVRLSLHKWDTFAHFCEGFGHKAGPISPDRDENSSFSDVLLVRRPRLWFVVPVVQGHVAAVTDAVLPDMVTERGGIVLRMGLDRPFCLPAGVAHDRRMAPAGRIFLLEPPQSLHAV